MNIRVDVTSMTVTSRLHASAARWPSRRAWAVMSVPDSGLPGVKNPDGDVFGDGRENRCGMEDFGAEYASSEASAKDRCGTTRGDGTIRGRPSACRRRRSRLNLADVRQAPKIAAE